MKILPVTIKLLAPMFNYCRVTNGGAVTSDFIGDIALTYALNRVRKDYDFFDPFRQKPDYAEIKELGYIFSVARPLQVRQTGLYTRNTLYNVDGGPDYKSIEQAGRALLKNYFKLQGNRVQSTFSACLFTRDAVTIDLPFAIRIGTNRECMVLLEKDTDFKEDKDEIWLNAFSIKTVMGEKAMKQAVMSIKAYHLDYRLENYILIKKVQLGQVKPIFEEYLA